MSETTVAGGSVALGGSAAIRRPARAPRPVIVTPGRAAWFALGTLIVCTAVTVLFSRNTLLLSPETTRPLTHRLAGPLSSIGPDIHLGGVIALFTLLVASYLAVVRLGAELSGRAVIGAVILVHVLMALGPPLLSTDVFSYTAYGRMSALYNINPYLYGPKALGYTGDPISPLVGALWVGTPSAYGPLFTAISYPLAHMSIATTTLVYKLLAVVCSLLAIGGVAKATERLGRDPLRAILFVGLNPVLLVYAVGGAHNDMIMLAAVAWAIVALTGHRGRTAGGLIVAALAVKLTAGIMLPFALAARREATRPHLKRMTAGAISVLLGVGIISTVLFGSGPLHLLSTLELIQANGGPQSIPGFVASQLGLGRLSHGVVIGFEVVLVGIVLGLLVEVRRRRMDWLTATGWAIVALLATSTYLLPWYVIWLLPFAALSRSRSLRLACLALTAIGMTSL